MNRITDPLTQGKQSKIYYLAYPGEISGYDIARKLWEGREPKSKARARLVENASVHRLLPAMERNGLISRRQDPDSPVNRILNKAQVAPFMRRFEATYAGTLALDPEEKKILNYVLDSDGFRYIVGVMQEDVSGKINAYTKILDALNLLISATRIYHLIWRHGDLGSASFKKYKQDMESAQDLKEWASLEIQNRISTELRWRIMGISRRPELTSPESQDIASRGLQDPVKLVKAILCAVYLPERLVVKLSRVLPGIEETDFIQGLLQSYIQRLKEKAGSAGGGG